MAVEEGQDDYALQSALGANVVPIHELPRGGLLGNLLS